MLLIVVQEMSSVFASLLGELEGMIPLSRLVLRHLWFLTKSWRGLSVSRSWNNHAHYRYCVAQAFRI